MKERRLTRLVDQNRYTIVNVLNHSVCSTDHLDSGPLQPNTLSSTLQRIAKSDHLFLIISLLPHIPQKLKIAQPWIITYIKSWYWDSYILARKPDVYSKKKKWVGCSERFGMFLFSLFLSLSLNSSWGVPVSNIFSFPLPLSHHRIDSW